MNHNNDHHEIRVESVFIKNQNDGHTYEIIKNSEP